MTIQSVTSISTAVYQVTYTNGVITCVPIDSQNADYVHVQAWIAAGGVVG